MPALLWLTLGVTFLGWASDYSAIMVAVRNDGHSLSAIAHRLISPRARVILFVFIFFYLLLLAGAFVGIMAGIFDPRSDVPFGIFMLAIMGLLMGQMLYGWKMDLILVRLVAVVVTLGSMAIGAKGIVATKGTTPDGKPATALVFAGRVNSAVEKLSDGINFSRPYIFSLVIPALYIKAEEPDSIAAGDIALLHLGKKIRRLDAFDHHGDSSRPHHFVRAKHNALPKADSTKRRQWLWNFFRDLPTCQN